MRKIDTIIVHCTATRAEWWESRSAEDKMAECKSWHLDRGWSDIGYHYLIDRDGTVTEGRPIKSLARTRRDIIKHQLASHYGADTVALRTISSKSTSRLNRIARYAD